MGRPPRGECFGPSFAWLALLLVMGGCHSYTPVRTAPPGSTVRVRVPVTSVVDNPNAPPQTVSLEGTLLAAGGDTIKIATRSRRELGAFRGELISYDTVSLAADERYGMDLVEFSTSKSVALGLGIAVGAGLAAVAAFGEGGSSRTPDGGGGGPVAAVISSSTVSSFLGVLFGR